MPDSANKVPDNEQKQKIYRYVSENESITTAETAELLEVKPRRARAVLRNMVNSGCLRKEGVARSTIYVKNTEGRSAVHLCRIVVHGIDGGKGACQD